MAAGRPSVYSEELAERILSRMMEGESLSAICREEEYPVKSTVLLWVVRNREGFSDRYAEAMQIRAHGWAEEIVDISDDGTNDYVANNDPENPGYRTNGENIQRSRLRVDSRKWLLSKLLPQYSDKPESTAGDDLAAALRELAQRLPA